MMDYESQELFRRNVKSAFRWIYSQVIVSSSQKDSSQIIIMMINILGLHNDVVDIIFNRVMKHVMLAVMAR